MAIIKATFGGVLAGVQRWSVGFTFGPIGSTTPQQLAALANQLFADFDATVWSDTTPGSPYRSKVGTPANLDSCRLYFKASSSAPASVVGASTAAAVAGSGGAVQAPQIALVVTLEDGLAGRQHKGRIYLPYRLAVDDGTKGIGQTIAQAVATQVADFLSLAQTRTLNGAPLIPIVSSATESLSIVRCSVDTILDTQRRRRDKITGVRVGAAVVAP